MIYDVDCIVSTSVKIGLWVLDLVVVGLKNTTTALRDESIREYYQLGV